MIRAFAILLVLVPTASAAVVGYGIAYRLPLASCEAHQALADYQFSRAAHGVLARRAAP